MFEKIWKVFFLGLSFFLVFGVVAFGQATGDITGTVSDPSGAVIPNAKVTATNPSTGVVNSTTSGSAGVYRIPNLNPGHYNIKIEAKGFKTAEQRGVEISAGVVNRTDISLQLGQEVQTVTVEAGAQLVSTEEAKLQNTVRSEQIQNLALNGRNVFDLIKIAPGAVNVQGVMFENGADTVVNGLRENFNGFMLDGVSNKQLSGGVNTQPNQDIVAEFTVNTLSMSAQYGSSAGSNTTMVTKSGSNDIHGDVYEYLRNDKVDASDFFTNQANETKSPLRYNQFGGSVGGPIIRDKTFFFASYQGNRTITVAQPLPVVVESAEWRSAVESALPNSTAALLYKNFPAPTGPVVSLASGAPSTTGNFVNELWGGFDQLTCPANLSAILGATTAQLAPTTSSMQALFGVTAAEAAACPGLVAGQSAAQAANRNLPFQEQTTAIFGSQTVGNLFNGTEWSGRIDHNLNENNRLFGRYYYQHTTDKFGPSNTSNLRGFTNPQDGDFPSAVFAWTRIVSPTVVNELRLGFIRNSLNINVPEDQAGVPSAGFGSGEIYFGAYNGYPQFFQENIYNFSDLISITHGKHSFKAGFDIARDQENSTFNVARPSYYFFDSLFFAADAPALEVAGVDPGIVTNKSAELATNNRAWRNLTWGAFFQDDWKASSHLTLNLGMRYDVYSRHHEKFGRMTQFILGSGANVTEKIRNANIPAGATGCDTAEQISLAPIAGTCGSGGFAVSDSLGLADHNNFSPRFGFSYDPTGKGNMAIRGGMGVSYEGTLFNPLSNSRWNLPFYSFNIAYNFLFGLPDTVVYGPSKVGSGGSVVPDPAQSPSFVGTATNPGQGVGAQAVGNLTGWDATNANLAFLTAVVDPENFRDPYVYNWFLGFQKQFSRSTGIEVNYVGTAGHKLFRAQDVNRNAGGRLPIGGTCASDYGSPAGANVCSNLSYSGGGRTNPNYGTLRFWENSVNSIYNSIQFSFTRRMSHGLGFNANYTWGHAIDEGSDWHSGATSANGGAAGDGYGADPANPGLDRGNSTFDIRHRLVANYIWELPWHKSQNGFAGHILGGWQTSGLWSFQTGAHWTAYDNRARALSCVGGGSLTGTGTNGGAAAQACLDAGGTIINTGGDYNLDRVANDRPDAPLGNTHAGTKDEYANGYTLPDGFFTEPCLGCNGGLGRNTFLGPNQFTSDLSIFKNTKISERVNILFRADFFNAFNRANFKLPSSSTGANNANRITSPIFGASAGVFDPRQIQFSLKLSF
jgi:Carboxypeptidase regulatory-like domain/TonB dependent receptor-like, beta-barrel